MGRNWGIARHGLDMVVSANGLCAGSLIPPYSNVNMGDNFRGETRERGGPWVIEDSCSEGTKVALLLLPEIS